MRFLLLVWSDDKSLLAPLLLFYIAPMASSATAFQRTSLQLYRDCLRLIRHVAPPGSTKNAAVKKVVKAEFSRHLDETNPDRLEALKANAIRALSNYMLATQAPNDPKVAAAAKDFHGRSVHQAQQAGDSDERRGQEE